MNRGSETIKRIDRRNASASAALMSNRKWRKLFVGLRGVVSEVRWKFVNDERVFVAPIPCDTALQEDGFGDCMPYPYGTYKEIDWILIPAKYLDPQSDEKRPLPEKDNNLELIKIAIERLGKFPLEQSSEGIKIIGYEW